MRRGAAWQQQQGQEDKEAPASGVPASGVPSLKDVRFKMLLVVIQKMVSIIAARARRGHDVPPVANRTRRYSRTS